MSKTNGAPQSAPFVAVLVTWRRRRFAHRTRHGDFCGVDPKIIGRIGNKLPGRAPFAPFPNGVTGMGNNIAFPYVLVGVAILIAFVWLLSHWL